MGCLTGEWWEASHGLCCGRGLRIQRRVHFLLVLVCVLGWIGCIIVGSVLRGAASGAAEKRTCMVSSCFSCSGTPSCSGSIESSCRRRSQTYRMHCPDCKTNLMRECSEFTMGDSGVTISGDPPSVGDGVECFETDDGLSCGDPGSSTFPAIFQYAFGFVGGVPVGFLFFWLAALFGGLFVTWLILRRQKKS